MKKRVVAVCLIKNEERFIRQVVSNIYDFSDEILIADNLSTDNTPLIINDLAERCEKIKKFSITKPKESHELIRKYCNTKTWIFAVDGDEIYDPLGLKVLRNKLDNSEFDNYWNIFGNVINCSEFDSDRSVVKGYSAPPCRSMTKLFNFNAIYDWHGCDAERLHGGKIEFKDGWNSMKSLYLYKNTVWEDAFFRCLHMCFLPRSSVDTHSSKDNILLPRINIMDLKNQGAFQKFFRRLLRRKKEKSKWKIEKYMRGELVEVKVPEFFQFNDSN